MSDNNQRELILLKFYELAKRRGIKNLSIEYLAKDCGISKKTVYKYFKSKDEIVNTLLDFKIGTVRKQLSIIKKTVQDPVEELISHFMIPFNEFKDVPTIILQDIRKYYPLLELKVNDLRREQSTALYETVEKGIKAGVFNKINPLIFVKIFESAGNSILNTEFIIENNVSLKEAVEGVKTILISGLLKESSNSK